MNTKRYAVIKSNGDVLGVFPKGFRCGGHGNNFEYGPRDNEGIRHIQGTAHVERLTVTAKELEVCYGQLPVDWLRKYS